MQIKVSKPKRSRPISGVDWCDWIYRDVSATLRAVTLSVCYSSSAMWGQAVLVALAVVVAAAAAQLQPHLGGAINLFSRYGYLSISMRVVPRNDSNPTWIFREPTVDVFRLEAVQGSAQCRNCDGVSLKQVPCARSCWKCVKCWACCISSNRLILANI